MEIATAAAVDCYLQHADINNNPGIDINQGKVEIGVFLNTLHNINDAEFDIKLNGVTDIKQNNLLGLLAEMRMQMEDLPSADQLSLLNLTCDHNIFLEVLMGSIKNAVISFQSWAWKLATVKKSQLVGQINLLRCDFLINSQRISELQTELNELVNSEIIEKVRAMKLFEGLHSEKPSPLFLSLARNRNAEKMSQINDANGQKFSSDALKTEFVVSFFEKLYKKPEHETVPDANVIEDFLGPYICNSDIVQNSKLSEEERNSLEQPLTLAELDNSLKTANFRSASGLDGFSNNMIKKCWGLLRVPILNYANKCLEKGELTANFKGATIRLIPKKTIRVT